MFERKGLANLVGETITDIEVVDYDHFGDGERVGELYRITLADGRKLHFLIDGGDCPHYGTISPTTLDQEGKVEGRCSSAEYRGSFKSLKGDLLPGLKAGASEAERVGVVLVLTADVVKGGGEIGVADAGAEGAGAPEVAAGVAQPGLVVVAEEQVAAPTFSELGRLGDAHRGGNAHNCMQVVL